VFCYKCWWSPCVHETKEDWSVLQLDVSSYEEHLLTLDRLCGVVVRVPDYRSREPRFDSRSYQIF
jgi:hypothetical protein